MPSIMLGNINVELSMTDIITILMELTIYRFYSDQLEIHISSRTMISRVKMKFFSGNYLNLIP